jgi:hypothetical protein
MSSVLIPARTSRAIMSSSSAAKRPAARILSISLGCSRPTSRGCSSLRFRFLRVIRLDPESASEDS